MNYRELDVYQHAEKLADLVWEMVASWDYFARDTVGKQLVRAADSVGANIAEGAGRGTYQDNRRFVVIARGSLYEVQHFLRRAHKRQLISQAHQDSLKDLNDSLPKLLNGYLASISRRLSAD